jgi:hypothetical protein
MHLLSLWASGLSVGQRWSMRCIDLYCTNFPYSALGMHCITASTAEQIVGPGFSQRVGTPAHRRTPVERLKRMADHTHTPCQSKGRP